MDPFTIGAIGVNIAGPILGEIFSSSADEEEMEQRLAALAEYTGISVPQLRELHARELGRTNLAGVTTDASLDAYEDESLARLAEVGRSGGLDANARARMEEARLDAAGSERAQREAILQQARQRGTAGYGEDLSAMLQAGQGAADRERMAGVQALSDAETRALGSIAQTGAMAGARQGRQFQQRAQVATAQDRIDEFNAGTANDFAMFNEQQRWRQFDARLGLADARANARNGIANAQGARADRTRGAIGGAAQGVGMGLGAYGQAQQQPQPGVTAKPAGPQAKRRVV